MLTCLEQQMQPLNWSFLEWWVLRQKAENALECYYKTVLLFNWFVFSLFAFLLYPVFSDALQSDKILSSSGDTVTDTVIFNLKWENLHRKGIWNLLWHMVEIQISRALYHGNKHSSRLSQNTSDVYMFLKNSRRSCTLRFTCLYIFK